jgi:hypothetical protein
MQLNQLTDKFNIFVKTKASTPSQKADLLSPYGYTIEDVRFIYSKASRDTLMTNSLLRSILIDKFLNELELELSKLKVERNDELITQRVESNSKILALQQQLLANYENNPHP